MKKTAKIAGEKAGQLYDWQLSSLHSRSQSPAPADPDLILAPPIPLSPVEHMETRSQLVPTPTKVPVEVRQSSQIVGAPQSMSLDRGLIPLAKFLDIQLHANPQAEQTGPWNTGSEADKVSEMAHRLSTMSWQPQVGLTVLNNNQNTTYSSGGDVLNYNPVINHIHVTEAEKNVVKMIKIAMGKRFVPDALHGAQPEDAGCMQGTRFGVLSMLTKWAQEDPMRIFWLTGLAGTGKTSIAITLCRMLQNDPKVLFGGGFFCSRTANVAEQTDARSIIPTLATALARKLPRFAAELAKELETDDDAALKPISGQIAPLLQKPLAKLPSLPSPIVFVVDALDECSGENGVRMLLQVISTLNCTTTVKFILTSRPETHISSSPILSSNWNSIMRLHTIDQSEVTEDIRMCITDTFTKSPTLARPWYSEMDVKMLATLSGGLFIFASTIIAYVLNVESVTGRKDGLPRTTLLAVQESTVVMGRLNAMYNFVLTRASDTAEVEPKELEVTLKVLASILAARVPPSVSVLADLLGLEVDELQQSLKRLHALIPPWGHTQ